MDVLIIYNLLARIYVSTKIPSLKYWVTLECSQFDFLLFFTFVPPFGTACNQTQGLMGAGQMQALSVMSPALVLPYWCWRASLVPHCREDWVADTVAPVLKQSYNSS